MQALQLYAGPKAMAHIAQQGLSPADIAVIPAAAGGPKGLILGPLDRFLFGDWLPQSQHTIDLVGASIGAWRMATACLAQPQDAFDVLSRDYIAQDYQLQPGEKRPSASAVSQQFAHNLQLFFGGRVQEVLQHPRYRLHVVASRGQGLLAREGKWRTPLGYTGAFLSNVWQRKTMGRWLERTVFSSQQAALPFGVADYPTRQINLEPHNFMQVIQASCSIPFVLQAVHDIPGAPHGAYWDGGITDYHLHLDYKKQKTTPDNAANKAHKILETNAKIVLYPHFQRNVVPGWLDKSLKWRHKTTSKLDHMLLLAPSPDWIKTLPNAKLPDRRDFAHYGQDLAGRMKAWTAAVRISEQLAADWAAWLRRPDLRAVKAL